MKINSKKIIHRVHIVPTECIYLMRKSAIQNIHNDDRLK